jgi:hypothetical protein
MSTNRAENPENTTNKTAPAAENPSSRSHAKANEVGAPGSFDVDQLVALRHDRKGRVEFLVRWKTYDASHDTWVSTRLPPLLRSLPPLISPHSEAYLCHRLPDWLTLPPPAGTAGEPGRHGKHGNRGVLRDAPTDTWL